MESDTSIELSKSMIQSGILLNEEDGKAVGKLMDRRIRSLNREKEKTLPKKPIGTIERKKKQKRLNSVSRNDSLRIPKIKVLSVQNIEPKGNFKLECQLESSKDLTIIFEFSTIDFSPEDMSESFSEQKLISKQNSAILIRQLNDIVKQLEEDSSKIPTVSITPDLLSPEVLSPVTPASPLIPPSQEDISKMLKAKEISNTVKSRFTIDTVDKPTSSKNITSENSLKTSLGTSPPGDISNLLRKSKPKSRWFTIVKRCSAVLSDTASMDTQVPDSSLSRSPQSWPQKENQNVEQSRFTVMSSNLPNKECPLTTQNLLEKTKAESNDKAKIPEDFTKSQNHDSKSITSETPSNQPVTSKTEKVIMDNSILPNKESSAKSLKPLGKTSEHHKNFDETDSFNLEGYYETVKSNSKLNIIQNDSNPKGVNDATRNTKVTAQVSSTVQNQVVTSKIMNKNEKPNIEEKKEVLDTTVPGQGPVTYLPSKSISSSTKNQTDATKKLNENQNVKKSRFDISPILAKQSQSQSTSKDTSLQLGSIKNEANNTSSDSVYCNCCDDNHVATSYCVDCSEENFTQFLCKNCTKGHRGLRLTKNHNVVEIDLK